MKTVSLKEMLSQRTDLAGIRRICSIAENEKGGIGRLYNLVFDEDRTTSFQALWAMTHLKDSVLAEHRYDTGRLADAAMSCTDTSRRRLMLTLLVHLPQQEEPRMDLLDFCLSHMMMRKEPPAIQCMCMKLAFKLCREIPELTEELRNTLEMMEPDTLSAGVWCARRSVLCDMEKERKRSGLGK